jgi:hypothetical protein
VLNSPTNDDDYENFALNASQRYQFGKDGQKTLKIGAGYLHGSIYDGTVAHHPPGIGTSDRFWNHLVNTSAELSLEKVDVMAEYTQSIKKWPATDSRVKALTVQGRYRDSMQAGRRNTHWPTLVESKAIPMMNGIKCNKVSLVLNLTLQTISLRGLNIW